MAKTAGLGDQLYISGYDMSGQIGAVQSLSKTFAEQDVTGLDKSAVERILLLGDGEIGFANYYDPVSPGLHALFNTLPDADALVSYFRGSTLGAMTASLLGKQINYGLARGADGSLIGANIAVKGSGYGLEYGYSLTAGKKTSVAAETLDGLDGTLNGYPNSPASNDPTVFVLHMFSMAGAAGDDVTVEIWDSDDDAVGDPYAKIAEFTNVDISAVPTAERITLAATHPKMWLQVRTVTVSNYPTSVVFAVAAIRGVPL
jgi:hypothetical protein